MLTTWQKRQLFLIQIGFLYLPDFPLVFKQRHGALEICFKNSNKVNIGFWLMNGINLITALSILSVVISKFFQATKWEDLSTTQLITICFGILTLYVISVATIFHLEQTAIFGLNQLYIFNTKIQKGQKLQLKYLKYILVYLWCKLFHYISEFQSNYSLTRLLEMITCVCILFIDVWPFLFVGFFLLTESDPYFLLAVKIFGDSPLCITQLVLKCVFIYLFRPFVLCIGSECARTGCYLIFGIASLWCTLLLIITTMSGPEFHRVGNNLEYFQSTVLAVKCLEKCVHDLISFGLSAVYWLCVFVFWFLIRFYKFIPIYVFIWIFSFICWGLAAIFLDLRIISRINDGFKTTTKRLRDTKKYNYALQVRVCLKRIAKIHWKMALALKPITIFYKPFCHIDNYFCLDFLQTLSDRVIDLLLVF